MKSYLIISGNVQGVGYRAHVRRSAHQHHIHGFVRNRPDGTVEAFAVYAKAEQLQAFVRELDRKARVSSASMWTASKSSDPASLDWRSP